MDHWASGVYKTCAPARALPAQDTNAAQYELVRLLVGDNGNVFVVGDPDQVRLIWPGPRCGEWAGGGWGGGGGGWFGQVGEGAGTQARARPHTSQIPFSPQPSPHAWLAIHGSAAVLPPPTFRGPVPWTVKHPSPCCAGHLRLARRDPPHTRAREMGGSGRFDRVFYPMLA